MKQFWGVILGDDKRIMDVIGTSTNVQQAQQMNPGK